MEKLVDRARAAMNLVLAVSLIAAWACFATGPDVTGTVLRLYELASSTEPALRSVKLSAFINRVEVELQRSPDLRAAVSELSVADVLSLSDVSLPFNVRAEVSDDQRKLIRRLLDNFVRATDENEEAAVQIFLTSLLSPEGIRFRRYIREFEGYFAEAKIREEAPVWELEERGLQPIKMPFIDQHVSPQLAVVLLAAGLIGPLSYLISVCITIRKEARFLSERVASDWVFFHLSSLGPVLGSLWIISPAFLFASAWAYRGFDQHTLLLFSLPLVVLGAWSVWEALVARKAFLNRLGQLEQEPPARKGAGR